jgi:hypothetical protein
MQASLHVPFTGRLDSSRTSRYFCQRTNHDRFHVDGISALVDSAFLFTRPRLEPLPLP